MRKRALLTLVLTFFSLTLEAKELKAIAPRAAFSALKLTDLDGRSHDLSEYKGKVVLVNFWATWCPPCRAEMPSMQRLKQKMAAKPFVIVAVDMAETPQQIRAFTQQMQPPIDFTILLDKDGRALKDWKVFVFPTSYILDRQGKIRYSLLGSTEWDDPATLKAIESLLPRP